MKINLRKAAVIQQALQDELKRERNDSTDLRISVFDADIKTTLDAHQRRIQENLARTDRLLKALYTLRQIVARANAEAGITDRLAEEAHLAAREAALAALVRAEVRPNESTLMAELQERRSSKTDSIYSGRDYSMSVPILTESLQNSFKGDMDAVRRLRRRLRDDMVTINVKTEIEVPEEVSQVLTELGLD